MPRMTQLQCRAMIAAIGDANSTDAFFGGCIAVNQRISPLRYVATLAKPVFRKSWLGSNLRHKALAIGVERLPGDWTRSSF